MKLTEQKIKDICKYHHLGQSWKAIALFCDIGYTHLIDVKNNPKSELYKQLTYGTATNTTDMAGIIVLDIAMNGNKDSDRLNACKLLTEDGSVDVEVKKVSTEEANAIIVNQLTINTGK